VKIVKDPEILKRLDTTKKGGFASKQEIVREQLKAIIKEFPNQWCQLEGVQGRQTVGKALIKMGFKNNGKSKASVENWVIKKLKDENGSGIIFVKYTPPTPLKQPDFANKRKK